MARLVFRMRVLLFILPLVGVISNYEVNGEIYDVYALEPQLEDDLDIENERFPRSPEPIDNSRRSGPIIQFPPPLSPTIPERPSDSDSDVTILRVERSPEPRRKEESDFPPRPSPTFPEIPKDFDSDHFRYRRSPEPEPFVYRPPGGMSNSGFKLPPYVNPTFPKNGGVPDAYKNMRFRRSAEPEHFDPFTNFRVPTPDNLSPYKRRPEGMLEEYVRQRMPRSAQPEPLMTFTSMKGNRQYKLPPYVTPTFPQNGGLPDAYKSLRSPRSANPEPSFNRPPGPYRPSPTYPERPRPMI